MNDEKAKKYDEARARGMTHEQAVEFAEQGEPGRLASFGRGVAQGATLGFADEATSALKALPRLMPGGRSFGEEYGEEVAESRSEDAAAREAHPRMMLAGEIAGGVGVGAATGGAGLLKGGATAVRAGQMGRAAAAGGRLAAQGAGLGALEAAGRAEGGVADRLPEAAGGAVVGGVIALGLPFVGRGLKRVGGALGVGGGAPATRAADDILDALSAGSQTPASVRGSLTGAPGETLMEVGGENVRRLAETSNLYPHAARGATQDFLENRSRAQFPIVQGALESGTGIRRQNAAQLAEEIVESRRATAQPLYEQAYAGGQVVPFTPELADVLSKPSIRMAYDRARSIAAEEGVPLMEIGFAEGARSHTIPDIRTLDLIKRGLDDVLYIGRQPQGGLGPAQMHAVRETRARLMRELDRIGESGHQGLQAYSQARAAFAGDTAMMEALEAGRTRFHLEPPEELARLLDEMGPAEVEMFRRGAVDNVLHRLGNVPNRNDLTKRLVQSPNEVARMGLLFDDPQDYGRFIQQMEALAEQATTKDVVLGGSQTAGRQAQQSAFEGEGLGSTFGLRSLLDDFAGGRRTERATEKAGEVAGMLNRTDVPNLLRLLEGRGAERARAAQRVPALVRGSALSGVTLSDLLLNEDR